MMLYSLLHNCTLGWQNVTLFLLPFLRPSIVRKLLRSFCLMLGFFVEAELVLGECAREVIFVDEFGVTLKLDSVTVMLDDDHRLIVPSQSDNAKALRASQPRPNAILNGDRVIVSSYCGAIVYVEAKLAQSEVLERSSKCYVQLHEVVSDKVSIQNNPHNLVSVVRCQLCGEEDRLDFDLNKASLNFRLLDPRKRFQKGIVSLCLFEVLRPNEYKCSNRTANAGGVYTFPRPGTGPTTGFLMLRYGARFVKSFHFDLRLLRERRDNFTFSVD